MPEAPRYPSDAASFTRETPLVPESLVDKTHALLAPGQGNQRIGMGQELAQRSPAATEVWTMANRVLRPQLGFEFTDLVWGGTMDELTKTENAQPAIITDSLARRAALEESGQLAEPGVHAGYSLGFIVALVNSGALSIEGAVQLGEGRGKAFKYAIDNSPKTTMISFMDVPEHLRQETMATYGMRSCIESTDTQMVMGGRVEDVEAARDFLFAQGLNKDNAIILPVDAAFHSDYMNLAVPIYEEVVNNTPIEAPTRGIVIGATSVTELVTPEQIRRELVKQLNHTERWRDVIKRMSNMGVATMTELNQTARLINMTRDSLGGTRQQITYPKRSDSEKSVVIGHRWTAPTTEV